MSCIHIKQQMLRMSENSACIFHFRWNEWVTFQGQLKRFYKYRVNKRPISPFLEVGFEKFFDSHI